MTHCNICSESVDITRHQLCHRVSVQGFFKKLSEVGHKSGGSTFDNISEDPAIVRVWFTAFVVQCNGG